MEFIQTHTLEIQYHITSFKKMLIFWILHTRHYENPTFLIIVLFDFQLKESSIHEHNTK